MFLNFTTSIEIPNLALQFRLKMSMYAIGEFTEAYTRTQVSTTFTSILTKLNQEQLQREIQGHEV